MARIRAIKPGIMINEDLCALGPYAYILFTGLWMIADREGRFEFRPRRIKAQCMPMWDEISTEDVEQLLEKLCKSGFLFLYEVLGTKYCLIRNWHKHQHCDVREAKSMLPPPSIRDALADAEKAGNERDTLDSGITQTSLRNSAVETGGNGNGNGLYSGGVGEGGVGEEENEPSAPPPPPKKPTQKRKPPATERRALGGSSASLNENPGDDPPPVEEVTLLRQSLTNLAREIRMPPPDDGMVRRIFESGRGASAMEIHQTLLLLWRRNKFREMRSWGLIPVILADCFGRDHTISASA